MAEVSVVVPTYGRGAKIGVTLGALLASDTNGLAGVEIVVVDDGSPQPAAPFVEKCVVPTAFTLRCVRQANAGPAAARNRGYRVSAGDVVLFLDDDIIVPPDLVRRHVEVHRSRPGCVVYGRCPFAQPETVTPLFRYVEGLTHDPYHDGPDDLVAVRAVASGQISVERSQFDLAEGVYRDDLATPAAEEFDLALRLQDQGIPIYYAPRLLAIHDHPVDLNMLACQAFKHSKGMAEFALKYPRADRLDENVARVVEANRPARPGDTLTQVLKKAAKRLASGGPSRAALLALARGLEQTAPASRLLPHIYRALLAGSMLAGMRSGLAAYARCGAQTNCTPLGEVATPCAAESTTGSRCEGSFVART